MENTLEVGNRKLDVGQAPEREFKNPMVEWLRKSADRHERTSEPVWALLYRNEAYLMEGKSL